MKIKAEVAVLNEGWQEPRETEVITSEAEKTIEEWVNWFRSQLKEALANGQDVEIMLGRKPNGHEFSNETQGKIQSNNHFYV